MAAIPNKERIISALLLASVIGIAGTEPQITALLGEYSSIASVIGVIFFIALREFIKELGLQKGDLNNTEK